MIEFEPWPKIPRLFRRVAITEKIDGTNGAVVIRRLEDGEGSGPFAVAEVQDEDTYYEVCAQSRKRLLTPGADNFGFAKWVQSNAVHLVQKLGEGRHYGEWWGAGIQRGYGMKEKHFSLFNAYRWEGVEFECPDLHCVPVLYDGDFYPSCVDDALGELREYGSRATPVGYDRPEGIVLHHRDADKAFKVTLENDGVPKAAGIAGLREAIKADRGGEAPIALVAYA